VHLLTQHPFLLCALFLARFQPIANGPIEASLGRSEAEKREVRTRVSASSSFVFLLSYGI
jgi:hypothetical protein